MTLTVRVLRALLCAYLLAWEPLNVASETLRAWPTLEARGVWSAVELGFHIVVAVLTVAAAIALWNRSPHGVVIATLGIAASTARAVQIARFSTLPHDISPGSAQVLAVAAIAHCLFWSMFLTRYQNQLTDYRA
jgi:hypothetical protein